MSKINIHSLCDELNIYLMNKFRYKKPPARIMFGTINANRKLFDLYFRFRPDYGIWQGGETLVIARMYFYNTDQRNGTNLLKFLVARADAYGIKRIGLETVNDRASAFARRYGFTNFRDNHWIADVTELQKQLLFCSSTA